MLDETLPDLVAARSAIDQAKGALMVIYGISAEQAFRVLSWRSQETNTKLRDLAYRLVDAIPEFRGCGVTDRTRFDHLLLTVHERPDPTPRPTAPGSPAGLRPPQKHPTHPI